MWYIRGQKYHDTNEDQIKFLLRKLSFLEAHVQLEAGVIEIQNK